MFAFEITVDDVANVCRSRFRTSISDSDAKKLFDSLDTGKIESAALDGGDDMDSQTNAAYVEIKKQLFKCFGCAKILHISEESSQTKGRCKHCILLDKHNRSGRRNA